MSKRYKFFFGVVVLLLFLSSLAMECYLVRGKSSECSAGIIAFLLGWLYFGEVSSVWLVNLLFFLSLFLLFFTGKKNFATGMAALAAVLALSFLTFETIIKDEARNNGTITGYLTGYWLWVSAIILTFLLSLVNIFNTKETQK